MEEIDYGKRFTTMERCHAHSGPQHGVALTMTRTPVLSLELGASSDRQVPKLEGRNFSIDEGARTA